MAQPVKRLHYFDHQFLRAADFTAEQEYHLQLRRLHNRLLHTWGIAEGLGVSFQGGASSVTVGAGSAVDSQGRDIVVADDVSVELAGQPADATLYLTIAYQEEETDATEETGAQGNTRWTESPAIVARQSPPGDPGLQLVLARVTRQGIEVTGVELGDRRVAGAAGGTLDVLGLGFRDPNIASAAWVRMRLEAANLANLRGSLHVTDGLQVDGAARVRGDVTLRRLLTMGTTGPGDGATRGSVAAGIGFLGFGVQHAQLSFRPGSGFELVDVSDSAPRLDYANRPYANLQLGSLSAGNVGVNTTDPKRRLHVEDEIHAGGAAAGFSFGDRGTKGLEDGPGRRWVLYSRENVARLWTGRDVLLVKSSGDVQLTGSLGVGTAEPQRRLHVEDSEIHTGGPAAGFSFGDRGTKGLEDGAGKRWVLYSRDGVARLWTAKDVLSVKSSGDVQLTGALIPSVGNAATAGIQFPPDPGGGGGDRAYIRYFVTGGENTKLLIGNENDVDDVISFFQAGAERLQIRGGSVGIGTADPKRRLHVDASEIHSGGSDAGFSFGNRQSATWAETLGERWVLYASEKVARLWTTGRGDVLSIDSSGNMTVTGTLRVQGGKVGYVVDRFRNGLGDSLEEGDVVVIGESGSALADGVRDTIPITEADLASQAYDTRVCGVVCEVHGEAEARPRSRGGRRRKGEPVPAAVRAFTPDEIADQGHAEVRPGQIGTMVTLGAFSHCKVDAGIAPVAAGDLLTTSPTPGHAQKVLDPQQATGAILGKALGSLAKGKGKVPVLVMLQ